MDKIFRSIIFAGTATVMFSLWFATRLMAAPVNLNLSNATIADAVERLHQQMRVNIIARSYLSWREVERKDLNVTAPSVEEALNRIAQLYGYVWKQIDGVYCLKADPETTVGEVPEVWLQRLAGQSMLTVSDAQWLVSAPLNSDQQRTFATLLPRLRPSLLATFAYNHAVAFWVQLTPAQRAAAATTNGQSVSALNGLAQAQVSNLLVLADHATTPTDLQKLSIKFQTPADKAKSTGMIGTLTIADAVGKALLTVPLPLLVEGAAAASANASVVGSNEFVAIRGPQNRRLKQAPEWSLVTVRAKQARLEDVLYALSRFPQEQEGNFLLMATWGYRLTHVDLEQARVTAFVERMDWQKIANKPLEWTFDATWEGATLAVLIPNSPPARLQPPSIGVGDREPPLRFLGGALKDEFHPIREALTIEASRQLSREQLRALREPDFAAYLTLPAAVRQSGKVLIPTKEVKISFTTLTPAAQRAFLARCQEYDRDSERRGQDMSFRIDYKQTDYMKVTLHIVPQSTGGSRLQVTCEARLLNGSIAVF